MATTIPKNSVWSAMSYTPPRGRCNYKTSLMSPACPCLRFMLHPVKAATSFECDGCSHHASFHSLENAAEDTVIKKWAEQEESTGTAKERQAVGGAGRKRRKIADKPAHEEEVRFIELAEDGDDVLGADKKVEEQILLEIGTGKKTRGKRS